MSIYQENGYLNFEEIERSDFLYTWIVGGKGMGKTMNALIYLLQHDIRFVFCRRTEVEIALACNKDIGDIAKVMNFLGIKDNYEFKKIEGTPAIYKDGELMIIGVSLKRWGKLSGINLEMFDYLLFDEFIAKPNDSGFEGEDSALPQLFATIQRNKEISGRKVAKFVGLGNSFKINNPQFIAYDLVKEAEALRDSKDDFITKGAHILYMPKKSPILEAMSEAESVVNASEDYRALAIKNEFIQNDFTYIKKQKLAEYECIASVGYIYIYAHKSNKGIYVTSVKGRTRRDREYPATITGLERFRRQEWRLWSLYLDGFIRFDSYDTLSKFEYYFGH